MSLQGCRYGGVMIKSLETNLRRRYDPTSGLERPTENGTRAGSGVGRKTAMRRLMISCFLISILGLVSADRVAARTLRGSYLLP